MKYRKILSLAVLAVLLLIAWYWFFGGVTNGRIVEVVDDRAGEIRDRIDLRYADLDRKLDRIESTLEQRLDRIESKLDRLLELASRPLPDGMQESR